MLWTALAGRHPRELLWSSDGPRLVVVTAHACGPTAGDGARQRPTSRCGERRRAVPGRPDARARADRIVRWSSPDSQLFAGERQCGQVSWSPDGRWLLVGWPAADQWVFVRVVGAPHVAAVSRIAQQFSPQSSPGDASRSSRAGAARRADRRDERTDMPAGADALSAPRRMRSARARTDTRADPARPRRSGRHGPPVARADATGRPAPHPRPQALVTAETENRLLVVDLPSGRVVRRIWRSRPTPRTSPPTAEPGAAAVAVVAPPPEGDPARVATLRPQQVFGGFERPHIAEIAPGGQFDAYVTDDARGTLTRDRL